MAMRASTGGTAAQRSQQNVEIVREWMKTQTEEVCGYCTGSLGSRVYRHQKGKHPEPRPAFCSNTCIGYYDNRRMVELKAFIR